MLCIDEGHLECFCLSISTELLGMNKVVLISLQGVLISLQGVLISLQRVLISLQGVLISLQGSGLDKEIISWKD